MCPLQVMPFYPAAQIGLSGAIATSDKFLGGTISQQRLNFRSILIEPAFAWAFRSAEPDTCFLSGSKRFFGALADQIALYLGSHRERHGHDLRLYRIVQLSVAFDCIYVNTFV